MSHYSCEAQINILPDEIESCGAITQNESRICNNCEKRLLQEELSQARKLIAELAKAAEDFELRENHAEWCLIKKQYGGGCNCMDEKAYSLHECSARRDNRPSLPEEEFVIKELGFKE